MCHQLLMKSTIHMKPPKTCNSGLILPLVPWSSRIVSVFITGFRKEDVGGFSGEHQIPAMKMYSLELLQSSRQIHNKKKKLTGWTKCTTMYLIWGGSSLRQSWMDHHSWVQMTHWIWIGKNLNNYDKPVHHIHLECNQVMVLDVGTGTGGVVQN